VATNESLEEAIREEAARLGFAACGFVRADAVDPAGLELKRWLEAGHHGTMGWMEARAHHRVSPLALWPEARSAIALGMSYAPASDPLALAGRGEIGRISAYAQGGDYHKTVKKGLKALARFIVDQVPSELKVFVDTAPVMEKPLAQAAGLGWKGKHTNLVSRDFGSWLFLGEIYLSLELDPDAPEEDHCGSCRRCLDACPTDAFPAPYRLDARRCISYLTIEHKGPIPHQFRAAIGNRIYGCDDCLAACPWNKFAGAAKEPDFLPRSALTAPRLAELARLDDAGFRAMFAGTAVKRLGRDRFLRNVLIAIGNGAPGNPELVNAVRTGLDDASPLVRGAAVWALGRLANPAETAAMRHRQAAEADAGVREEWRHLASREVAEA
jgi:epoxyqueuosine reductase